MAIVVITKSNSKLFRQDDGVRPGGRGRRRSLPTPYYTILYDTIRYDTILYCTKLYCTLI